MLGLIVGLTLRESPAATMNEVVSSHIENNTVVVDKSPEIKSTQTTVPFVKHHNFNYADLFSWLGGGNKYRAGWIFFVLMTVFAVAAVSNGANLHIPPHTRSLFGEYGNSIRHFRPVVALTRRNSSLEQIPHCHLAVYNAVVNAVGDPECGNKRINKRLCRFGLLLEYAHPVP